MSRMQLLTARRSAALRGLVGRGRTLRTMSLRPGEWQVHGERAVYDSDRISVVLVDVEEPGGVRVPEHHVVRCHVPAAACLVAAAACFTAATARFGAVAWLGEVSSVVLQQALADLNVAYRNFFASVSGPARSR